MLAFFRIFWVEYRPCLALLGGAEHELPVVVEAEAVAVQEAGHTLTNERRVLRVLTNERTVLHTWLLAPRSSPDSAFLISSAIPGCENTLEILKLYSTFKYKSPYTSYVT